MQGNVALFLSCFSPQWVPKVASISPQWVPKVASSLFHLIFTILTSKAENVGLAHDHPRRFHGRVGIAYLVLPDHTLTLPTLHHSSCHLECRRKLGLNLPKQKFNFDLCI